MHLINKIVKSAFKAAGFNISKIANTPPTPLLHHNIELLFDVGANVGQYAMHARAEGYTRQIVSFEPLPDAYETLLKNSARDPLWCVHERCAIGSVNGEAKINVLQSSVASSLLPTLPVLSSLVHDAVKCIRHEDVKVVTLDSIFDLYAKDGKKSFLKIDTQGFEAEVLKGLTKNLANIFGIQLELSIVPLYKNQETYEYFLDLLERNGFVLWSLIPGFYDRRTGQLLQFDAIFVRER